MTDTIETVADRSRVFGSILRRIDHHAATLGAGHADNFEEARYTAADLEKTFDTLQLISALVAEAKEKITNLEAL